jgi:hypothetical protein
MPRTPKWVNRLTGSPPDMSEDELNETKGMGASDRLLDYAFWLDDPSLNDWLMAFDDVDKGRGNGRLLDLLKSEHDLPHQARFYLAAGRAGEGCGTKAAGGAKAASGIWKGGGARHV